MSRYAIKDNVTGMNLEVDGDNEPSAQEAERLLEALDHYEQNSANIKTLFNVLKGMVKMLDQISHKLDTPPPAPIVNVKTEAPKVTVAPTPLTVNPTPVTIQPPQVTVNSPAPPPRIKAWKFKLTHDSDGKLNEIIATAI